MPKTDAERRDNRRVPTSTPVNVRHLRRQLVATTRDISPGGMYLLSQTRIEEGTDIELVLMMPPEVKGGGRWLSCHAKVVRLEEGGQGGAFGIAAKIIYSESVDVL